MNDSAPAYKGHRYLPEIISHAVWLYHRLFREHAFGVWNAVTSN